MSALGGSALGVSVLGRVSLPGGFLFLGGLSALGGLSQHALRQTQPPVNRMTDRCKKYYLGRNFIAAGNKSEMNALPPIIYSRLTIYL